MKNKLKYISLLEKFLKITIILLFCLVVLSQYLLYFQPLPLKLTLIDNLEGTKIEENSDQLAGTFNVEAENITFKVISPYINSLPKGYIYVNGNKEANFTKLQTSIIVDEGDIITLDFTNYDLNIDLKVAASEKVKLTQEVIHIPKGKSVSFRVGGP